MPPGTLLPYCNLMDMQQPQSEENIIAKGSGPSGMKVWFTQLDKPPRLVKIITESEGNLKWRVEKEKNNYEFWPKDKMQQ